MRQAKNPGRRAAVLAITVTLSACGHLPAPEGATFAKLAAADKDAFGGLADRETDSGLTLSQALMRQNLGNVTITGCDNKGDDDCVLKYVSGANQYALTSSTTNARKLIGAVARYSDQMSTLAEAKDLDDVKAKASAAAGSLKALIAVTGASAIAGPIIDAAVLAGAAGLKEQRRRAMLTIATAAQPAVDKCAETLSSESQTLKTMVKTNMVAAIDATQGQIVRSQARERAFLAGRDSQSLPPTQYAELEALRDRRAADLSALSQEALAFTAAKQLPTDYGSLSDAHKKLVSALSNDKVSLEDATADAEAFVTIVEEARAATSKK